MECTRLMQEAQREMDAAIPALEAAETALNSLTKPDIIELRAISKPPHLIVFVMEAVCILLGER